MIPDPSDTNEISNILPDAYRDAICRMDLLAIYDLIPEYDYWDETQPNKSSLISRIRTPLAGFRFLGETSLSIHEATCRYRKCEYKNNGFPFGYTFVGNTHGCLVSFKFQFKYNQLISISECMGFHVMDGDRVDPRWLFSVLDENDEWRHRLRLDRAKEISYPCSWI